MSPAAHVVLIANATVVAAAPAGPATIAALQEQARALAAAGAEVSLRHARTPAAATFAAGYAGLEATLGAFDAAGAAVARRQAGERLLLALAA